MRRVHLALAFFALCTTFAAAQDNRQEARKMDTVAGNVAQQFLKNTPTAAISIGMVKAGQTYLYHYGSTEKGADRKPEENTLYEIGSITKTFTAIILAHAILEKRVSPDDDIRKYLPGDYPNLTYAGNPIRLIHLVNSTSRLPNNLPVSPDAFDHLPYDSMANAFIRLHAGYSKEHFLADLHHIKLDTIPGLNPRHTNAAAQLLTYLLENVYHRPFASLLRKYVTAPLKMDHTYLTVPADQVKYRAKGYSGTGSPIPFLDDHDAPAFGIKSTIADMTRYTQAQLEEKDPAIRLTHQVAWGNINEFALGWIWFLWKTPDGKLKIHEDGTTLGFTASILFYPQQRYGVVFLTNEYDQHSNDRLSQLADQAYEETHYTLAERASLGFGFSPSINKLLNELTKRGFDQAIAVAGELKNSDPQFALTENEVNNWAYFIMRKGDNARALEIFKLNIQLYPQSYNTFDSLAECYAAMGDKALAIKNYQRSLELNPQNTNATEQLQKLR